MKINPAILCYLPKPSWQCTVPAYKNFTSFKTKYPLVFYSASEEWPDAVRLKTYPENVTLNARYPNGQQNLWACNNAVFWTGMGVAKKMGFSHVLYLEVDCRVAGDGWDGVVFDEFFADGPGKLIGGTALMYSPCNKDFAFARAFNDFIQKHTGHPWPICAYGGGGCAEALEQVVMVNGALGVYDMEWLSKRFDLSRTIELARNTTAWDFAIGRELARQFGPQAFEKVVHLKSVYSLYKDRLLNEQQRIELLTSGKIVATHQVKSNWTLLNDQVTKQLADKMESLANGSVEELVNSSRDSGSAAVVETKRVIPEAIATTEQGTPSNAGSNPAAATPQKPRNDIFIVTRAKDVHWLRYCLQSIEKFATGFGEIHIAYPAQEKHIPEFIVLGHDYPDIRWHEFAQAPEPLGHLHHEIIKTRADEFCPEAEYILHMDSDCIFTERVTPESYFQDGKPVILIKSWAKVEAEKQTALCWREPTNQVLGFQTSHEAMQRLPMVYRRGLYSALRRHVEALHGAPFDQFILSRRPTFPYGYCEFGSLGSFALRNCPELYHWIDVSDQPHPHNPLLQMWSHGPMDKPQKLWRDGLPIEIVPIKEIKRVLEL